MKARASVRIIVVQTTAAALLWLTGCTSFPNDPPAADGLAPTATPTPDLLAQLTPELPIYRLSAAPGEFARLTERWEEDFTIDAEVSVRRNGTTVLLPRPATVKVKGGYSARFPQKSLGIKLEKAADNRDGTLLRAPTLAPGHQLDEIRSLRLRNGGNAFATSLIKDLAYARMLAAAGLAVELVYGEPAAVFVDGGFYGLANVRSEHNRQGLSRLVGAKRADFFLAEVTYAEHPELKNGEALRLADFERAVGTCDLPTLRREVALESLIDFAAAGNLFGMWDWPDKNVRFYSAERRPLRFVLYDFDLAATYHPRRSPLYAMEEDRGTLIADLFFCLYEGDPAFAARFDARYAELLRSGVLAPEVLRDRLAELRDDYEPLIAFQTARWGVPESNNAWHLELERIVSEYRLRYGSVYAALVE